MRALVCERYGGPDVIEIREVERPEPAAGELLIRVLATTVSAADWRLRSATFPTGFAVPARLMLGVFGPRRQILGGELSGEVVAVGSGVSEFRVGDRVFAHPGIQLGCHAEYRTMRQDGAIARIPEGMSAETAAAMCFGACTALNFLRDQAGIVSGDEVLIVGASGAVGSAAVQLAKHFGAHVTAVCSTDNLELVRSLGADEVIDYAARDFRDNGKAYDLLFDAVGVTRFASCSDSLKDGGRLLLVVATLPQTIAAPWVSLNTSKRVCVGDTTGTQENLLFLKSLAEAGAYTPLIDRVYPLEEARAAHAYVDTGRKKGNVVLRVG